MKHSIVFAALLASAGLIASFADAAPPESSAQATTQAATNVAPGTAVAATSGVLNRQGGSAMNFASPDYVPPPPGQAGSPGTTPNGGNSAQTPNGSNNARNPNGNNNAQAPNGSNNAMSPSGGTNAPTVPNAGGSSPSAVPTTIN